MLLQGTHQHYRSIDSSRIGPPDQTSVSMITR
jgi:hypothetical protein